MKPNKLETYKEMSFVIEEILHEYENLISRLNEFNKTVQNEKTTMLLNRIVKLFENRVTLLKNFLQNGSTTVLNTWVQYLLPIESEKIFNELSINETISPEQIVSTITESTGRLIQFIDRLTGQINSETVVSHMNDLKHQVEQQNKEILLSLNDFSIL